MVADASKADNSFFSPATRKITYGSGGIDDAEDADVILHEYGHAIQDAQVPGFGAGNQAGSIGEGFGDFWAAVMSALSPDTTNADDVCIFDWDGVGWGKFVPAFHRKCGRRADSQKTLPAAQASCRFEIHCVGKVWSSALWALRTKYGIGAATLDRIVLASQFMYTSERALQRGRQRPGRGGSGLDRRRSQGRDLHRDGDQPRHLGERLPLSARPRKRLTRRCQGGGTPAGRLAQTGQRSPIEVVSGGVLDGWVVSSKRKV